LGTGGNHAQAFHSRRHRVRPGVGRRRDGGHERTDVRRRNGAGGPLSVSLRVRRALILGTLGSVRAAAVRRLPVQEWRQQTPQRSEHWRTQHMCRPVER
jgi:hypothetical protein